MPNPSMPALCIRQPWAWLIVHAGKTIENRDWPTAKRGRVLVHASKQMTRREYAEVFEYLENVHGLAAAAKLPKFEDLPRGGIVGMVEIVDCVRECTSPWFFGKFGFVMARPIPLPFRPWKGALGFFNVPCVDVDWAAIDGGAA